MDENRIKEIFFIKLINNPLSEALIASRKQLLEELLADLFMGEGIDEGIVKDEDIRKLILKINDAWGRIGYFTIHPQITISRSQDKHLENLKFIYLTWKEAMEYVSNNFESITSEEYRKENSIEEIREATKVIAKQVNSKVSKLNTASSIIIHYVEMRIIELWFETILKNILIGEAGYALLEKESDKIKNILTNYQQEILTNKKDRIH